MRGHGVMKGIYMYYSPLRYPGGKGKIAPLIRQIMEQLNITNGTYIEPFAGGAGVALELLETGFVKRIVINDYDKGIASFWKSVINETDRFVEAIYKTPLTMREWRKQREYAFSKGKYSFELGFATFYMNRTNRSGIIKGGPIGGYEQSGEWTIASRFNRETLANRVLDVAKYKSNIYVYNKEIKSFITRYAPKYQENALIYFDPPYFNKGKQLYMNYFNYDDHKDIEELVRKSVSCDWIITYDDVPEILEIYRDYTCRRFDLSYTAAKRRESSEIIVFKSPGVIPDSRVFCEGREINLRGIEAI